MAKRKTAPSMALTCVAATQVINPPKKKFDIRNVGSNSGVKFADYKTMGTLDLDKYIKHKLVACHNSLQIFRHRASQLAPALLEMERRFDKKQGSRNDVKALKVAGWHDYLKSLGVSPSTFRSWKLRDGVVQQIEKSLGLVTGSSQRSSDGSSQPFRLDGRKQAALVRAQLAANDLVAAVKNDGDVDSAIMAYEKVAVTPTTLNSYADDLEEVTTLEGTNRAVKVGEILELKMYDVVDGRCVFLSHPFKVVAVPVAERIPQDGTVIRRRIAVEAINPPAVDADKL